MKKGLLNLCQKSGKKIEQKMKTLFIAVHSPFELQKNLLFTFYFKSQNMFFP